MKNVMLFPLDDNNRTYWYLESPYDPENHLDLKGCLKRYNTFMDLDLSINEDERIISKFKIPRNDNKIIYTFQYFNASKDIKIRSDIGYHNYPHIDIEINGIKQKNLYDTEPSDYEAVVNTVLRYVERTSNKFIGLYYWLYYFMNYNERLLHIIAKTCEEQYSFVNVALTDIARLASIELYKIAQEGKSVSNEDLIGLIIPQYTKAVLYEKEFKRPLKISKNILSKVISGDVKLLPFPIIVKSTPISLVVDNFGNIIDKHEIRPTGIVAYKNNV